MRATPFKARTIVYSHDEERQDRILLATLDEARKLEASGDLPAVEAKYEEALAFASTTFGHSSKHVASVWLAMSAFYAACDKPYSSKSCFMQTQRIMRF